MASSDVTEWSTESRTGLSFLVNERAVASLLPPGWKSAPSSVPAARGANLTMTLMDRVLVHDADGQPKGTGTTRYLVLSAGATDPNTGWTGTVVIGGISPEGAGVYDVYLTASEVSVVRSSRASSEDGGSAEESWQAASATGDSMNLHLRYRRGPLKRSQVDMVVRSARHPEFSRTYHVDQASELLRSGPLSIDRLDEFMFQVKGSWFEQLFDGSEQLVSVTSVPYYARTIEVP